MMRRIRSILGRKPAPRLRAGDTAYMSDIREALLVRSSAGAQLVLYLVAVVLCAGLVWAHFARVEEVTRSDATVVSPSREQWIQSLEGGIVQSVAVREGDVVEKGQLLAKLDPARAQSSYREALTKALELKASVARARAEAYGAPLDFPADVKREAGLVAQATATYRARRRALDDQIAALEKSQALVRREIAMSEPLAAKGLVSEVEILRMRRQATDIAAQIAERRSRFTAEASTEIGRAHV